MFEARRQETPCQSCEKPLLDPENIPVWELFVKHLANSPRVGAMGGFLGLEMSSVPMLLEAYEVPSYEWPFYLDKIAILNKVAVKHWNKDTGKK